MPGRFVRDELRFVCPGTPALFYTLFKFLPTEEAQVPWVKCTSISLPAGSALGKPQPSAAKTQSPLGMRGTGWCAIILMHGSGPSHVGPSLALVGCLLRGESSLPRPPKAQEVNHILHSHPFLKCKRPGWPSPGCPEGYLPAPLLTAPVGFMLARGEAPSLREKRTHMEPP